MQEHRIIFVFLLSALILSLDISSLTIVLLPILDPLLYSLDVTIDVFGLFTLQLHYDITLLIISMKDR